MKRFNILSKDIQSDFLIKNFDRVSQGTFCIYAFFLPIGQRVSTVLLVFVFATAFIEWLLKKMPSLTPSFYYSLPIILYLFILPSIAYSDNIHFNYLEQRASLLAIPIIFYLANFNKNQVRKLFIFFVFGCLTATIICYANATYNSLSYIDGNLVFQPVVNPEFSFLYSVVRDGNYYFSSLFSILHDNAYYALYLNTSIAIMLHLDLWKQSKFYSIILFVFILVVFQLSNKAGIVTCCMLLILYVLFKVKNLYLKPLLIVTLLITGIIFFGFNPRGKVMVDKLVKEGLNIDPNERFGYQLRLMSWDASLELIRQNPILGVGINDAQQELNALYKEKNYTTPLKNNFNSHNQFLQTYLETGLPGVTVLLLMLFSIIVTALKSNNFLCYSLLMIVCVSFLFESVMNRYSGISFFTMCYCLLFTARGKEKLWITS